MFTCVSPMMSIKDLHKHSKTDVFVCEKDQTWQVRSSEQNLDHALCFLQAEQDDNNSNCSNIIIITIIINHCLLLVVLQVKF